jgi:hypothetical protein
MTSKYFGEFLVEKGVITKENLVDALIEQIATTPPLCQVIYQKKILPLASVFDAFRFQQDHQVEFMQACKSMGLWTKEVQDKAYESIDEMRKPLGHILVSKGLIDLKKLTHMLDEFLSQLSSTPANQSKHEVKTLEVKAPEVQLSPIVSAGDLLADLPASLQPGILMELDETFDEKKRKMIRVALSLVKDNAGTDVGICKKLIQDVFKIVHGLNEMLSMLALDKLSEFLTAMEFYLNNIQGRIQERSKESVIADTELLTKSIDLAWSLRLSIMANATEREFFKEQETALQFSNLMGSLKG